MFAIDHLGKTNMLAQEVPSAVGMRGFYIPALGGTYDFDRQRAAFMERNGTLRPVSLVKGA